ncbi:MAG: hypothetical protein HDQ99_19840 [Lachnospiraceae bacterium]|nr:hypothetical protein [Lachnospiraceae bacterium]
MANGRIKINELPETALIEDNDIFIIENDTTTQKISLGSLINYIKEHEEIAEHFVKQSAVDSKNGVAPLDSSRKIPSANLPFGSTENTVYDGALGQSLSDNLSSHLSDTANPHTVTKSQVGLSDVDNTADAAKPVSTLQQKAIDAAYANSNAYTDVKIAELIDGAPSTLDTLGEIAHALQKGGGISDALDAAIGSKASQAELDSHTGNDTIHITASERTKWNSKMGNTEDACNTTVTFSEASDLSNINSGEKTGSIMGKISKAISTLISHISLKATADTFGHVKLSDTYQNAVTGGNAANGMGASQKALADAYSELNSNFMELEENFHDTSENLQSQITNLSNSNSMVYKFIRTLTATTYYPQSITSIRIEEYTNNLLHISLIIKQGYSEIAIPLVEIPNVKVIETVSVGYCETDPSSHITAILKNVGGNGCGIYLLGGTTGATNVVNFVAHALTINQ